MEKVIRAGKKTAALGKKLGFTPEKMGQLKRAGKLETAVAEANKRLKLPMQKSISIKESTFSLEERQILQLTPLKLAPLEKRAMVQWWQQTAPKLEALSCKYEGKPLYRAIRREFSKEPLSELQIRKLLHHAGYKTYPRPTGLPSDFIVELADKRGGMIYRRIGTTEKENIIVRVMPGTRKENVVTSTIRGSTVNGRWRQQTPYVTQRRGKDYLTRDGTWIEKNEPALTHIPLEIFEFKGW